MTVGPPSERFAAEGVPLEVADQKILTNEGAVALVAAEDACLVVVELVSKQMIWARVAFCAAGLITCVPHLGG